MGSGFPLLVIALAAVLTAACGRPAAPDVVAGEDGTATPVTTAGQAVDDAVLSTRVKTALLAESAISGGDISVSSERGQVTLSGSVPREQIRRATAIARRVQGVEKVINALTPASSS